MAKRRNLKDDSQNNQLGRVTRFLNEAPYSFLIAFFPLFLSDMTPHTSLVTRAGQRAPHPHLRLQSFPFYFPLLLAIHHGAQGNTGYVFVGSTHWSAEEISGRIVVCMHSKHQHILIKVVVVEVSRVGLSCKQPDCNLQMAARDCLTVT